MRRLVALLALWITTAVISDGQTFSTLVNFDGINGSQPSSSLVPASNGNFYGVTDYGGFRNTGTAFKMTPDGVLTTLYVFCVEDLCPDSLFPKGALIQASDGKLYGTTYGAGGIGLYGTVFRMTPEGDLTTLHNFQLTDGAFPASGLIQGRDGNFYGTASGGGTGGGTVFKITPVGILTTLHTFGSNEGYFPYAGLVQASDGNFYGATYETGRDSGTVFRITPAGVLTTLHTFDVFKEGGAPPARLVQAKDGNLYGVTSRGGLSDAGTIFKITLQGELTVLYKFCLQENCPDGKQPVGSLIQATDGNFYGTTSEGGQYGWGTVFRMTPDGGLTTLHDFNRADGGSPSAAMVQAPDGSLYGTTSAGGSHDLGTVFRLIVYPALTVAKSGMGTVISGDGHIYCGSACSYWYFDSSQIGLTAIPAPGYTFDGWTGCDKVNGNFCSVTMDGAKNVTAAFAADQVTLTSLTFSPSYVKGGRLSAGTVTLSAPAPPGGVGVAITNDHPGVVHPQLPVVVPGGKTSVSFTVNTFPVKMNTTVTIMATAGASQVSGTLTVGTSFQSQSAANNGSH